MNNDLNQGKLVIKDLLINYYFTEQKNPKSTLVFLHGWRSNSSLWFTILPKLIKNGYKIYALDFPGFGLSQMPTEPLVLQDYVDLVVEFMNKLEIKKPIIIGHSHGGRVGIKLASQSSDKIEKLILVDSGGVKHNTIDKTVKKGVAKVLKPVFMIPAMKPLRTKIYQSMGADDYVATPELTKTFVNIINEDIMPLLELIKTDTLLIWGENDKDTPLEDAKIMKSKIPHSHLEVIKDAEHYSFLNKPDEFIDIVSRFINT